MKLLSWMRAIKQNGDFSCLRAQVPTQVQLIRTDSFSFSGPFHNDPYQPGVKEELRFDDDGFCGFLAIGTLGTDPETPRFLASVTEENVIGEKKDMAKLITEKLDKFLEECPDDATSSSESKAEGDRELNPHPLQAYDLSGELTKRSNGGVKKKKGLFASLFKRRTVEEECSMEKHVTRDHLIKKILEKLHGSSYSMPKKKDLRKSVQIFPSKVHPVLSTPGRDNSKIGDGRSCDLKIPIHTRGFPGSSPNRKRENWIKTDAEYLVLEL